MSKNKKAAGTETYDLGKMGEFVGFRLRRVQNKLAKKFGAATTNYELRSGLFSSLSLIAANPGISQNELAIAAGLDKSVAVQIIDELEERGYARREKSKTDRRRHALYSSPKGEAFLDELFGVLAGTEESVFTVLTPQELKTLKELLDRLYTAVSKEE